MQRTPSGNSVSYSIEMQDYEVGEVTKAAVTFEVYPQKAISLGVFESNNASRMYYGNSGVFNSVREILKAIARLYNLPVAKRC